MRTRAVFAVFAALGLLGGLSVMPSAGSAGAVATAAPKVSPFALRPYRVLDRPITARGAVRKAVVGHFAVPLDATAVQFVLRVVDATSAGSISVWDAGSARPARPAVSYERHTQASTTILVPIGRSGAIRLRNNGASRARVRLTSIGYVGSPPPIYERFGTEPIDTSMIPSDSSCLSDTFCFVVDSHGYASIFDGHEYSRAVRFADDDLTDFAKPRVSCASTRACLIVRAGRTYSWNLDAHGSPWGSHGQGAAVGAFSCTALDFCLGIHAGDVPSVEVFDGMQWSPSSYPALPAGTEINAISCTSSSFCMAAGTDADNHDAAFELADDAWQEYVLGIDAPAHITCTSTSFCVALDGQRLATTWDGSAWSGAEPTGLESQADLWCTSSNTCTATGNLVSPSGYGGFARFDGSAWTTEAFPNQTTCDSDVAACFDTYPGGDLTFISCPSPIWCEAGDGDSHDFVRYRNDDWSPAETSPLPADLQVNDNSCADRNLCVTVAQDGWVVNRRGPDDFETAQLRREVDGISCSSDTFCMGTAGHSTYTYDGETWSHREWMPGRNNGRTDVACTSSTFCLAVGDEHKSYRWDGTSWHPIPAPEQLFYGKISCVSRTFCAAVGGSWVAFWDGNGWTKARRYGDEFGYASISCPSTLACVVSTPDGEIVSVNPFGFSPGVDLVPSDQSDDQGIRAVSCPSLAECYGVGGALISYIRPLAPPEPWK